MVVHYCSIVLAIDSANEKVRMLWQHVSMQDISRIVDSWVVDRPQGGINASCIQKYGVLSLRGTRMSWRSSVQNLAPTQYFKHLKYS